MSSIDAARLAHHYSVLASVQRRRFVGVFLDITNANDRAHNGIVLHKIIGRFPVEPSLLVWLLDGEIAVRCQGIIAFSKVPF